MSICLCLRTDESSTATFRQSHDGLLVYAPYNIYTPTIDFFTKSYTILSVDIPSTLRKPVYIFTLAREYPRQAIAIITVAVIAAITIFAITQHHTNQAHEAARNKTAAHWASAGLQTPVTTLKDGGDKRTVGSVGKCIVTVEGFTAYTSLVITSNEGNPVTRQEVTFHPTELVDPDETAYDYIGRLQEIAPFCLVG